jgi:AcrR family transcriptional regulator
MAETRRDSLISAAADLLDRGGPAAVTLREVGRAAGVSHNAPYKHFADKDDLLAAVAGRELRRQAALPAPTADGAPPTPQMLMVEYVRWAQRYPERFKLTFGRWSRANPELGEAAARARTVLIEAVAKAQRLGDLPAGDPERLAVLMLALAHGAADLALAGHLSTTGRGRADPENLVADLFRHLKASAGAKG